MLEHGANIHARNKKGQTPLHRALNDSFDGLDMADMFLDTMRYLLAHGADVDALDDVDVTPLHMASHRRAMAASKVQSYYWSTARMCISRIKRVGPLPSCFGTRSREDHAVVVGAFAESTIGFKF
jgi:hypothetical protein